MKANHNVDGNLGEMNIGAFNISKIQDESKSQRSIALVINVHGCFQYFKDTR